MSDEVKLLPCDHCGRDERQHTEIMGVGLMCHIQGNTFDNSKSAKIRSLSERIDVLEADAEIGRKLRLGELPCQQPTGVPGQ